MYRHSRKLPVSAPPAVKECDFPFFAHHTLPYLTLNFTLNFLSSFDATVFSYTIANFQMFFPLPKMIFLLFLIYEFRHSSGLR